MKAVLDFMGCMLFMIGVCTPNDSVLLTAVFISAGAVVLFRADILNTIRANFSTLQKIFPGLHHDIFLSSGSKRGD